MPSGIYKRKSKTVFFDGKETTIPELTKIFGFSRNTIYERISSGWNLNKILENNTKVKPKYWAGKKRNEETKKKISQALVGRKLSDVTKEKIRQGNLGKLKNLSFLNKGENHPRWIKDRTQLAKRQERNDVAYQDWRKNVWIRDKFRCRMNDYKCSGKIIAHHILGWSKFPELRYEVNNGITLCHFHHPHKRNDEMKLSPYFQDLVTIKVY